MVITSHFDEITDQALVNFCLFAYCDLISYDEVASDEKWIKVIKIQPIEKKNTWELTTLPIGKKLIGVKWVYNTNYEFDSKVNWFKVRLVTKGYKQKLRIDYFKVFTPVTKLDTIHMTIILIVSKMWKIHQIDKSLFS